MEVPIDPTVATAAAAPYSASASLVVSPKFPIVAGATSATGSHFNSSLRAVSGDVTFQSASIDTPGGAVTVLSAPTVVAPIAPSRPHPLPRTITDLPLRTLARQRVAPPVDAILSYSLSAPISRQSRIKALRITADGVIAVSALDEEEVAIFRAPTGGPAPLRGALYNSARFRHTNRLMNSQNQLTAVAFSPDGRYLLTAARDCLTVVWDIQSNRACKSVDHDGGAVLSAAFAPDGQQIVVGKQDKRCTVFDARRGDIIGLFLEHRDPVLSVAWAPNGRLCCSASADRKACLWRPRSPQVDPRASLWEPAGFPLVFTLQHKGFVLSCAFTSDSQHVLTNDDRAVHVWSTTTGECLRTLTNPEMAWPLDANRSLASAAGPHFAKGAPGQLVSPRFVVSAYLKSGHIVVTDVASRVRIIHPVTYEVELELSLPVPIYAVHSAGPNVVLGDGVGNVFYLRLFLQSDRVGVARALINASDPAEAIPDVSALLAGLPMPTGFVQGID